MILLLHGGRAHSYEPVRRGNLAALRLERCRRRAHARTLLIPHGRRDRITDTGLSLAFASRAATVADAVRPCRAPCGARG
jgi:hypothetical protein